MRLFLAGAEPTPPPLPLSYQRRSKTTFALVRSLSFPRLATNLMRPNVLATSDHPSRLPSVLSVLLGSLEAQVMEVLWTRGECKVREVMRTLDRDLAYTTVMTTLDRLFRKKLLDRRKSGRAYIYSPRVTCQEWKDKMARDVVARLLAGPQSSREALIACLLEAVGTQDGLLLEFQKAIRKRRS